jgi:hypothetical protein
VLAYPERHLLIIGRRGQSYNLCIVARIGDETGSYEHMENSASWLAVLGGGVMEKWSVGVLELWSVGLEETRSAESGGGREREW